MVWQFMEKNPPWNMREAIKNSSLGYKGCTYSWRDSGQLGGTQVGQVGRGHEDEQGTGRSSVRGDHQGLARLFQRNLDRRM